MTDTLDETLPPPPEPERSVRIAHEPLPPPPGPASALPDPARPDPATIAPTPIDSGPEAPTPPDTIPAAPVAPEPVLCEPVLSEPIPGEAMLVVRAPEKPVRIEPVSVVGGLAAPVRKKPIRIEPVSDTSALAPPAPAPPIPVTPDPINPSPVDPIPVAPEPDEPTPLAPAPDHVARRRVIESASTVAPATHEQRPAEPVTEEIVLDVEQRRWRRALIVGLSAYLLSRLCVLGGAFIRASQVTIDAREDGEAEVSAVTLITQVFTSWDGRWYLELVRLGYPDSIPANITYDQTEARAAFFPMYPGAVRVFDSVLPGGDTFAALFLNFLLGGLAVVLVGLLARRVHSASVAARAMVLFAVFPGSFVLSFAYSEALFIVFAASCLLLLQDEQWMLAGLAGALATATRPNGVAIVFACVVAAVIAIRTKRQWSSLLSVLLAPVGFVGFQLYVDDVAGERGAWFRVQREAWSEGTSFGVTAVENTYSFVTSPFDSTADALTVLSLLSLLFMGYALYRRRLPLPWVAFSAVIVALMLIPETVTARPRFVFTAFPLFIAVAAWWPQAGHRSGGAPDDEVELGDDALSWERQSWNLVVVACGAGLAILTNLYGVFGAIP